MSGEVVVVRLWVVRLWVVRLWVVRLWVARLWCLQSTQDLGLNNWDG